MADYYTEVMGDNPALWWRFLEHGTTTVQDETVNDRDGTLAGAYTQGLVGLSTGDMHPSTLFSDGHCQSSYFGAFTVGAPRSYEFVAMNSGAFATMTLLGSGAAGTHPRLDFNTLSGGVNFQPDLSVGGAGVGTWAAVWTGGAAHHLVLTFDPVTDVAELWLDGVSKGTRTVTADYNVTAGAYRVGKRGDGTVPLQGWISEAAIYNRILTSTEIQAHSAARSEKRLRGGRASFKLALELPNMAGATTRTITADEADGLIDTDDEIALSRLLINLPSDSTDYIIDCPQKIKNRAVIVRGGRHIQWVGGEIEFDLPPRFFPGNDEINAIAIENGPASPAGRKFHLEGVVFRGPDQGDQITIDAAANVDLQWGNCRVEDYPCPRNSASIGTNVGGGPPDSAHGVREYQAVAHHHNDCFKANGDFTGLTADRVTLEVGSAGIRFDHGPASISTLRRCNMRSLPHTKSFEGPIGSIAKTWSFATTRVTFEASQENWTTSIGGAVLTWPYTTAPAPLAGTQSLRVSMTAATSIYFTGVGRNFTTPVDWSGGGASSALSCLFRLTQSVTDYPMARIDVSTTTAPFSAADDWYFGNSQPVAVGTTEQLICTFPTEVLAAIKRIRVILLIDSKTATPHHFIVDSIASGQGTVVPTFTGPPQDRVGTWGLYHSDRPAGDAREAGLVYLKDVYGEPHSDTPWRALTNGTGEQFKGRVWDWGAKAYITEPAPGGATIEDYVAPATITTGTDSIGSYVSWTTTNGSKLRSLVAPTTPGSARLYQGPPPNGDFCPVGIAGVDYVPAGYLIDVDAAALDLKWDVASGAGTPVDGAVLDLKWDVRQTVNGSALSLKWDLTGKVAVNAVALDLKWDLLGATAKTPVDGPLRRLKWDLAAGMLPYAGPMALREESSLAVELSLDPNVAGFAPFQAAPEEGPSTAIVEGTGATWQGGTPTNVLSENAITSDAPLGAVRDEYPSSASGSGWGQPTAVCNAGDDVYAYYQNAGSAGTTYLVANNFGFAIPSTATIEYVQIGVRAMVGVPGDASTMYVVPQLRIAGAAAGAWGGAMYFNFEQTTWGWIGGQPGAGWGVSLTPAQVNASNFGFHIYCEPVEWALMTAYIEAMTIGVWYTDVSRTVKATNFGFTVPGSATIDGIKARVRRKTTTQDDQYGDPQGAWDQSVKIVKAGAASGTEKAVNAAWPTALADRSYGGGGDKWGLTWTPGEVNSSGFGVAISAYYYGTAQIDYIELTVYYTEAGVSVATTGQPKVRFGPEEADAGRVLTGTSFSTEMPGGFSAATFTVQRPEFLDPAIYLYAAGRLLEYETGRVLHEGRVVGVSETAEGEVGFELEGWGKSLTDNKTVRQIFYDRDLSAWGALSLPARLVTITTNQKDLGSSVTPDPTTGSPALTHSISETGTYAAALYSYAMYDAKGLAFGKIDFAWKKGTYPLTADLPGSWSWRLFSSNSDDITDGFQQQTNQVGAGPAAGTWDPTGSPKFAYAAFDWTAAPSTWTGLPYELYWTSLGVIGDHGLTVRGATSVPTNAARGLYPQDVLTYIIEEWGGGDSGEVLTVGEIQGPGSTPFAIPHLVFKEPTTPLAMIEQVCTYGGDETFLPLDWYVYEDRKIHVFDQTQHGTTWRVRYSEGTEASDAGPDVSTMLNGVMVQYDDGSGGTKTVGPPGSEADLMDTRLIDLRDSNPANRDGSRHWELFSAGITSRDGAIRIGQVILAERNVQEWRGEITIKRRVRDSAGNVFPASIVRAGDYVVIEDDEDTRPRRVVNTSCDATAQSVNCSIGAEPDRHDVFLAKAGLVLEAQL